MQSQTVLPTQDPSSTAAGSGRVLLEDGRILPLDKALPDNAQKGMYLALFDGRKNAASVRLEPGFDGPVFGPLQYVKWHDDEVTLQFVDADLGGVFSPDAEKQTQSTGVAKPAGEVVFLIEDGLIEFEGHFFSTYAAFMHAGSGVKA